MVTKKSIKNNKEKLEKKSFLNILMPWLLTLAITIILLLIIILFGNLVSQIGRGPQFFLNQFFSERLLITTITSLIVLFLMKNYITIYLKTKASFSLGLIVVSVSLLIHSMISNPLLLNLFNIKQHGGLFSLISVVFTFIAALALLILSKE
jgi:hypothetical protein